MLAARGAVLRATSLLQECSPSLSAREELRLSPHADFASWSRLPDFLDGQAGWLHTIHGFSVGLCVCVYSSSVSETRIVIVKFDALGGPAAL